MYQYHGIRVNYNVRINIFQNTYTRIRVCIIFNFNAIFVLNYFVELVKKKKMIKAQYRFHRNDFTIIIIFINVL